MSERMLLRIALLCTIVGLAVLLFLTGIFSVDEIAINKVDGTEVYAVKVYGAVASVRSAGQGQVLEVTQPATIEVFVSSSVEINRGDIVEVIGRSDIYQAEPQLIAERIRVVRGDDS
jgi:DNA/RNA endonuclease YhcR with UshA esterase domain